jgi:hypothetical protein
MTPILLAKRTLTNLYNSRPNWFIIAHRELAEAILSAYGWENSMSDVDVLEALRALNLERDAAQTVEIQELDDLENEDQSIP